MTTVINTNLASLFAQNSLSNAQNNLATSVQRLSSGLRINSAKDDAAGLAIAQNMQSQINGTNQSINNLSDATNLLQTADSSLSTIQDMLLKMKQLAVQGYDGSLNSTQKADIVTQMQDLNNEINATAQRTQFNGINLLTSGSSIDAVNSDLKTGATLVNTQVAVLGATALQGLGYYSTAGSAVPANLGDSASTGIGAVNSTFKINIDPTMQNQTPGNYTLTSNGANLTLTGTINGLSSSQTVVVGNVDGGNQGGPGVTNFHQNLNFSNFGINIDTYSTVSAGTVEQGQTLATALVAKGTNSGVSTIQVAGQTGTISDVRLSGTAPGTYSMTYDNLGAIGSVGLPTSLATGATTVAGNTAYVTVSDSTASSTGAGGSLTATLDGSGNITALTAGPNGGSLYKAGDVLSTLVAGATATTTATDTITIGSTLTVGQTLSIGGLTVTATGGTATIASITTALQTGATSGNAAITGTLAAGYTATTSGAGNVLLTYTANKVGSAIQLGGTNPTAASHVYTGTFGFANALSGMNVATLGAQSTATNLLTLSGTVNGVATKQSVQLQTNNANNTETINFASFGVSFDVKSNQTQQANDIGFALANLNSASSTYGTTSNYVPGQIVVGQGNNSNLQFQSGANSSAFIGINTLNVQTGTTGSTAGTSGAMMAMGTDITGMNATGSATGTLGAMTSNNTISDWQTAFQNAAAAVDKAVDYISTQRATYGSQMNRLSYISTNLTTQSTNLQTSKSSITDTNFASETANLTKGQIMQQAATAMLAQANQMPNVILSLLK